MNAFKIHLFQRAGHSLNESLDWSTVCTNIVYTINFAQATCIIKKGEFIWKSAEKFIGWPRYYLEHSPIVLHTLLSLVLCLNLHW